MTVRALRLTPSSPTRCGDYDLDAVVIEHDDMEPLGFRLELGRVMDILWAVPTPDGDRLRLIHVDAAAYHVDPSLEADPFVCDLPLMTWDGGLVELADGASIVRVEVELCASPATYRCVVSTQDRTGVTHAKTFASS